MPPLAFTMLVAAASVFVSPTGSDLAPCTRAAPCASFDRAYRVAAPGAIVELEPGFYPAQTIRSDPRKTSPQDVVFRAAPGAQVTVTGEVDVHASHLELRGLRLDGGWYARPGASDLTFRNVRSAHLFVTSASHVRVLGGSIGPGEDYDPQISSASPGAPPPTDVLIDGVRFHDWTRTGDQHVECLQVGSAVRLTIRNSRFSNCETHDVFVRSWGRGYPLRDVTIENNFFGKTRVGFYSLRLAKGEEPCERFLVRHNSATQNLFSDCDARDVRFRANVMPSMTRAACTGGGSSWDWNVYGSGVRCGPNDRVGPLRFRDPARFDLHLLPGSAAIGRGDPAGSPARDIDGDRRPVGSRADAGADELR